MKKYDYIILGGGCAGLSLAFHMKKRGIKGKKILILEAEKKNKNDRTWCFWTDEAIEFQSAQDISWKYLAFKNHDFFKSESLGKLTYHHIKGSDFYAEVHEYLYDDDNYDYRQERVINIEDSTDGVFIQTTLGSYQADWVFNSIPPRVNRNQQDIWLQQHFVGFFLETEEATFKVDEVTFMDFSTSFPNAFFYVLPFSDKRALIEFTVFSPEKWQYEAYVEEIEAYLKDRFEIGHYEIMEVEQGSIPMSSHRFARKDADRIINIGTRGGQTKPTTGYTFLNIQEDSRSMVDHLIQHDHPVYPDKSKKRYRFYDNLLLDIIKQKPEKLAHIMRSLFKRNKITTILQFLDEKTPLHKELYMLLRLPWMPFFRAIYRFYFHGKITQTRQPSSGAPQPVFPVAKSNGVLPVD